MTGAPRATSNDWCTTGDDGAAAPRAGGGGGGSSDPRAGSEGGFRCRPHGVRAGSARIDRVGLAQARRRSAMSDARRQLFDEGRRRSKLHTAARRALRRRRVRRSAAEGRCGTAGGSGAELGDGTQLRGVRFGPHSLPASTARPRGSTSTAPLRAAGRSIRLLCGSTDCSCSRTSARCVCGWRAGKGEGGARRGDKIIAFSGTILGDAWPASPPPPDTAGRSNPGCCVEK